MTGKPSKDPWGDFWALSASGSPARSDGCLPQRWAAFERILSAQWQGFAASLAQGAAVLDLATGDGRVMGWMLAKRPDLECIGVDLSPSLPPPPEGARSRAGIAMEALPFEDGSMNAVVSQFGYEYGNVEKVTAEIARVLIQGGRVGLIVHRGDGPILEHNRQRRAELMWALKEKGAARKVRTRLKTDPQAIDAAAAFAERIAAQGAKKFGETSPAWEIPEAIKRSCLMGRRFGASSIIEAIGQIESHAGNEVGRIGSLAKACATADRREAIHRAFDKAGLAHAATLELAEPSGRAFADFLVFE